MKNIRGKKIKKKKKKEKYQRVPDKKRKGAK